MLSGGLERTYQCLLWMVVMYSQIVFLNNSIDSCLILEAHAFTLQNWKSVNLLYMTIRAMILLSGKLTAFLLLNWVGHQLCCMVLIKWLIDWLVFNANFKRLTLHHQMIQQLNNKDYCKHINFCCLQFFVEISCSVFSVKLLVTIEINFHKKNPAAVKLMIYMYI
jgi:hypothetical protein